MRVERLPAQCKHRNRAFCGPASGAGVGPPLPRLRRPLAMRRSRVITSARLATGVTAWSPCAPEPRRPLTGSLTASRRGRGGSLGRLDGDIRRWLRVNLRRAYFTGVLTISGLGAGAMFTPSIVDVEEEVRPLERGGMIGRDRLASPKALSLPQVALVDRWQLGGEGVLRPAGPCDCHGRSRSQPRSSRIASSSQRSTTSAGRGTANSTVAFGDAVDAAIAANDYERLADLFEHASRLNTPFYRAMRRLRDQVSADDERSFARYVALSREVDNLMKQARNKRTHVTATMGLKECGA
jgi:hypothetical protein